MKRNLTLELTPAEVKQAIVDFARRMYEERSEYSADAGIEDADATNVVLCVKDATSNARYEADRLVISAKVEVEHSFDTSS